MERIEQSGNTPSTRRFHYPGVFEVEAQGHTFRFLPSGRDRLEALLDLIHSARVSLKLCFYIFSSDESGQCVRDALIEAAQRGVAVTLIIDGFGAQADESFFEELIQSGGKFREFSAKWSRRYLIRNHQKFVLVDEEAAMIGGFNIENSYFQSSAADGWHDLGLVIHGGATRALGEWFGQLEGWVTRPRAQFRAIRRMVKDWSPGDGSVRLLIGGPTRGLSSWARYVGKDLARGSRLDMIMAYFSPSARLLRRIGHIAKNGQARLILAGRSDNAATLGATRSLYDYLLHKQTQIFEFAPCKLHTKLIVVDETVYIGSANFDMRSLYINLELMLRIEDAELAEQMRAFISQHVPASQPITTEYHRQRATLWNRIRWVASWFLVSVVDYTVSRRLNLGL